MVAGIDQDTRQEVILQQAALEQNILLVGRTGSGKSSVLFDRFIVPQVLRRETAPVIFDSQNDVTDAVISLCDAVHRPYVVYPEAGGAGVNVLGGAGTAEARAARFADTVSQSMEAGPDGMYYTRRACTFIRRIIPLYERVYHQPMILLELLDLAQDRERTDELVQRAGVCPEAAAFMRSVGRWPRDEWGHTLAGLCNLLEELCTGDAGFFLNQRQGRQLTADLEARTVVIVRAGGDRGTAAHTAGLFYILALQEYAEQRHPHGANHFVPIYLDEAYRYFNRSYGSFINTSRKKGMAQHLCFQSFSQCEQYVSQITAGCLTWLIFPGLLHEDATRVAENVGKRLYALQSRSYHGGTGDLASASYTSAFDYLHQPSEVQYMPGDTLLLLSMADRELQPVRRISRPAPYQWGTPGNHPPISYVPPRPPARRADWPVCAWDAIDREGGGDEQV